METKIIRRKKRIWRKKHPNSLASTQWKKTVINCTIPVVTNTTPDINSEEYIKEYNKIKNKRIEYLKTHYSNNYNTKFCPLQKFKKRKQPWFMLTRGKCYNYEERKEEYGSCTKPYRVESETKRIQKRYAFNKIKVSDAKYMELYVQHKFEKWKKRWDNKNPKPEKDLFEEEFLKDWKIKKEVETEQALERIRDFVVSVYDKLPLIGRFKLSESRFVEEKIADLKDKNMEGHRINELDLEKSKLMKTVQKITNETYNNQPNLIATNIKDHKRKKGRLILPTAA